MLSNYTHLKDTIKIILAVAIIASLLFIIIGFSTHNGWDAIVFGQLGGGTVGDPINNDNPIIGLDCPLTHTWNAELQRCDIMWNSIYVVGSIVIVFFIIVILVIVIVYYWRKNKKDLD